ncbi:hypothetical protein [Erythrobacter sp. HKB08]|uniref:hypothetical protein n=1 Tax=Erythrobacter sp. HKB08 TaxID=2502843 RepID=UPI001F3044BB|nr:hypothetical protein [Erythrobacter sp. HKB08]
MVLLQSVVPAGPARAQTIVNVANASWSHDGREYSGRSNPVELQVATRPPEIVTYVPGMGEQYAIYQPSCGTSISTSSVRANAPTLTNVKPTSVLRAGQDLIFTIALPEANTDAGAIDSLAIRINGRSGDQEEITVFETGENTGVFAGRIATRRTPPPVQPGDCVLSVVDEDVVTISALRPGEGTIVLQTTVSVLADPFGVVFDSETGAPVSGAVVSLVDAITGQPAQVFAEDGVTPWPSTVISGEPVTDATGNVVEMGAGEFWFPLTNLGTYVLRIEPPSPYSAPSQASPNEIARLTRPDGRSFVITDASYGASFVLTDPTPVQIDIPLDAPSGAVAITKEASRQIAQPGDAIFYTLTVRNTDPFRVKRDVTVVDTPSVWLRPRLDSVRIDGAEPAEGSVSIAPDGRSLQFSLGDIAGGSSSRIVYAMTVRPDAQPGYANNVAVVTDSLGRSSRTEASVRVERDAISGRMTIIGRISAGDCSVRSGRIGIPGVRVMLEDGSFAITDRDGRYHFDGVVPGTHVVQASPMTLPEGSGFVDCNRSSRSAGSATSLFVIGQGGSLAVADFHATVPQDVLDQLRVEAAERNANSPTLSDTVEGEAIPNETDWLSLGDGPDGWLAPTLDANPRAPAIRVAIRHRKEQTVRLFVDGKPVDALAFDGIRKPERGGFAVSTWRGVPLSGERTLLAAEILGADGFVASRHERPVFFTNLPTKVELVADQSRLVADGRTRPVVAVRILDRNNRPLREGVSGDFTLNAPYESAEQITRQQLNQLTRQGPTSARWTVADESGIALIELAPTMTSGALQLTFRFDDGEVSREQQLETWIAPGDIDWTVVGLAEASIGSRTVADGMDRAGNFASDLGEEARVAVYAKGPVAKDLLVTFAYDSAKDRGDQRVLGTLDPQAYYTVFGDASVRQFDAASREKVYARVEGPAFNVQYGDFETNFDQTRLANYRRVATGVSGEARIGQFGIKAFGAEAGTRFRRDEIQGQGISGPYRLGSRAIVPNTENVILEVRDRFRSELIVERRELTRFLDYDIDFLAGTISFKQPVLSRDFDLNPQFIVIEYETDQLGGGVMNAGGRIDWRNGGDTLRIGATMISDGGDDLRTNIVGLDLRAKLGNSTELRAEIAGSRTSGENSMAWLIEAQHQSGKLDLLAYAKSAESTFGVGQQNNAELGRRKIGADARMRLSEQMSIIASLWQDDSLTDAARRRAAQVELGYSSTNSDIRVGIAHFDDRLTDGTSNRSTVLEAGATQRMFHNKLELTAATSMPLDSTDSVDLPLRHRVGARYAITNDVRIIADYEFADGNGFESSTLRGGFELTPWVGGRVSSTLGKQDIGERGNRSFAAFGLAQTWQVNPKLSLDATFDSNWTLDGSPQVDDLVNVDQPAASGGQFGPGGALFEDFTAVTLGGAWRDGAWSATARGEYRDGEYADRWGVSLGAIRQLGEGSVVGSGFSWTTAEGTNGAQTEVMDAAIALAHRPAESEIAFLGKLEFRSDSVSNAVLGEAGPAGRTALTVSGDAGAKRLIASLSTNWSPRDGDETEELARRSEIGLFLGARYNLDSYGGFELDSVSTFAGLDARIGVGERFEIGASATVRANLGDDTVSYAVGPNVGFVPAKGVLLNVGYNITGFRDPDFSGMRDTDEGLYASVRIKFDADSFSFLGLGRK